MDENLGLPNDLNPVLILKAASFSNHRERAELRRMAESCRVNERLLLGGRMSLSMTETGANQSVGFEQQKLHSSTV